MSRSFARQAVSLGLGFTLGTFNDNFFKQSVLLLAVGMGYTSMQSWGTVLFSLPFVLFSAWGGWLADRYPKRRVILAAKLLELAAMLVGAWGLLTLHWGGLLAMLFCMGASATLFSPALNGSLPEVFPPARIPQANAFFKLSTTASILLGVALAGAALDSRWFETQIPFGRWLVAGTVVLVALLGLCSVALVPWRPAAARREDLPPFPLLGAWQSARDLLRLRAREDIFLCFCADAFFYSLSVLVLLEINTFGLHQLGLSATMTSLLPGALMLGICLGALLAARRRRQDWWQTVPPACAGMGMLLVLAGCVPLVPEGWHFGLLFLCYAATGVCGSLYIVPVSSYLQIRPAAGEKGRILGVCNFFSFLGMLLAGAFYSLLALVSPAAGHVLLGLLSLALAFLFARRIAALPRSPEESGVSPCRGGGTGPVRRLLLALARLLLSLRYRVRLEHEDVLREAAAEAQARGCGMLLLPNHPSFMDPVLLCTQLAPWAPRPLADRRQIGRVWVRPLAAFMNCIPLPDLRREGPSVRSQVTAALDRCAAALAQGDTVLLYPSGSLSTDGRTHLGGNSGAYRLWRAVPGCPLVVVRTQGLWGSSFSRADGTPVLGRALLRGLGALLLNGLFFMPRREVRISFFRLHDLPRPEEGALALNARLEAVYQAEPDVLRRVPFFRWHRACPDQPLDAEAPAATSALSDALDSATMRAVGLLLAEASPLSVRPEDMRPDMRLDADLGLDSLAVVDLALRIEGRFGHAVREPGALQTVHDCLRAASGRLAAAAPEQEDAAARLAAQWRDSLRSRPETPLYLPEASSLPLTILRQLRRAPSRPLIADGNQLLSAADFWTRAVALSLYLRRRCGTGGNLGILLPASAAAGICWLAVLLSGNTPVMLNWTTGMRNLRHGLTVAGVRYILCAHALLRRLDMRSLQEAAAAVGADWLLLEDVATSLSPWLRLEAFCRARLSLLGLEACVMPRRMSPHAAILFTSGSSAAPKGVPLTHENILANCRDVAVMFALTSRDVMLAMLPPFHSLGLTGNIVLPLCLGMPVVCHANPTEGARLAGLCRRWRPSLLLAPPSFLDGMLREAQPGDLDSLRLGFVGAEACPQRIYDAFARQTGGGLLCEGYGVTECSPLVCVNLPQEARPGTIGRPLPSVRTAIVTPQAPYQPLPPGQAGLLLVRGPNVFEGYLAADGQAPASPFLMLDGQRWYCTGDLVRADADGHMTFAGRRDRFIKMGGEMISLPQLEAVLRQNLVEEEEQGGPVLAVDAVAEGGQTLLVLYTTLPVTCAQANAVLHAEGFSGLHMLRRVCRLESLPLLGSGKIDYRRLSAQE